MTTPYDRAYQILEECKVLSDKGARLDGSRAIDRDFRDAYSTFESAIINLDEEDRSTLEREAQEFSEGIFR